MVDEQSIVPKEEAQGDPNEYNAPGQEEKLPYQPVTPLKKKGHETVIVPTSAENVERQI